MPYKELDLPSLGPGNVEEIPTLDPAIEKILAQYPSLLQSELIAERGARRAKAADGPVEPLGLGPLDVLLGLATGGGSLLGNLGTQAAFEVGGDALSAALAGTTSPLKPSKPTAWPDPKKTSFIQKNLGGSTEKLNDFLSDETENPRFNSMPEGYYIHGTGEGRTGLFERTLMKGTSAFGDADFKRFTGEAPAAWEPTQKLDPKELSRPTVGLQSFGKSLKLTPDGEIAWTPDNKLIHEWMGPPTKLLTPDPEEFSLLHEDLPKETPKDLLYHGLGVWGASPAKKLDSIKKHGLSGGWFSENPVNTFGGIDRDEPRSGEGRFLAVSPKHLPPAVSQRRFYPEDPPVEIIPNWRGGGVPLALAGDELENHEALRRMGALGRGKGGNPISVHPYHIFMTDENKNILGRLGRSRWGKKATNILKNIQTILKETPKE